MPYEHWRYARRVDADAVKLINSSNVTCLQYKNNSGVTELYGQIAAGSGLTLIANQTDTEPYLALSGSGTMTAKATNHYFRVGASLRASVSASSFTLTGISLATGTNEDLYLNPNGTGVVKFGTKTGTGDVAVDGYVSIKDAAGNAVKLATVA